MTLYIWKYKDTPQKNYFEGCTYIDKIAVNNFLEIPSFTQEFNSETDYTQLKTDNFTVRLSKLSPELSAEGDSLENFLFPSEEKDYKFLVLFEPKTVITEDDTLSRRAGFLQLDSLVINDTHGEWYIEFTVIGILREFAEYYETKNIQMLNPAWDDITFDNYMQNLHFTKTPLWEINNRLDLTSKVSFEVKVSTPLQSNIIYRQSVSQWRGFKDIALELGFAFQLICHTLNPYNLSSPYFTLHLFWRSEGLKTVSIKVIEHVKGISQKYNNKWVYMANRHHIQEVPNLGQRTDINGWMMNADTIYNFDTPAGINNRPIFSAGGTSERIGNQGTNIVIDPTTATGDEITIEWTDIFGFNEKLYSVTGIYGKIAAGVITYARIFVQDYTYNQYDNYNDWGVTAITVNTAIPEYRFLLRGIKEIKKLKAVYDGEIGLFCTFDFTQNGETKTFLIERIANIDLKALTCEIDAIEI